MKDNFSKESNIVLELFKLLRKNLMKITEIVLDIF